MKVTLIAILAVILLLAAGLLLFRIHAELFMVDGPGMENEHPYIEESAYAD